MEQAEKKQKREKMQKKRQERAKKAEEKVRKQQENARAPPTRGCKKRKVTVAATHTASVSALTVSELVSSMTDVTTATAAVSSFFAPCTSVRGHETSTDEVIDLNRCCMYFVSCEDDILEDSGAVLVSCKCSRWLHKECIEDVAKDSAGDKRYYSFCIDKYTV